MKKIFLPLLLIIGILTNLSCCKKKDKDDDDDDPNGATKIEMAVSPWPCYGQNHRVSFASPYSGPAASPSEKWKVNVSSSMMNHSLIIGADGTIYVNARRALIAVKPEDGSVKWRYDVEMDLSEAPVIDKNNIVYIAGIEYGQALDTYGDVVAIKADSGTLKWTFNSKDSVTGGYRSSPNIGYEGYLYVAENNVNKIYALNTKGEKVWEFTAPYAIIGMPAVGNDSVIYITSHSTAESKGSLIALAPGGTQKWKMDFNSGSKPTPPAIGIPVGNHGYIYVSYNAKMICFKKNGTLDWSLNVQSGNAGTKISVSNTESVYFHDDNSGSSFLICMKTGLPVFENPYLFGNTTIGNDDNIYCTSSSSIKSHNLTSKTDNWTFSLGTNTADAAASYAVMDKNGVMYIATEQGYLIALQ